jgi:hypothetical protein
MAYKTSKLTSTRFSAPGISAYKPTKSYSAMSAVHKVTQSREEKIRSDLLKKKNKNRKPSFDSAEEDTALLFFSTFTIKNKKLQNKSLAPYSTRIQRGLDLLEQQGVMPTEEFKIPPNDLAEKFLFGINCTLSNERKNFSLIDTQTDHEKIQNPNIFEENKFMNLRPAYIKVPDKFVDSCDPFYNLDDRATESERKSRKLLSTVRKPYLVRVASDSVAANVTTQRIKRLRYFTDISELNERGRF